MVAAVIVLFANVIFTLLTWPQLFRRVVRDPRSRDAAGRRTRFFTIHLVLFVIALTLAAASAVAGIALLVDA